MQTSLTLLSLISLLSMALTRLWLRRGRNKKENSPAQNSNYQPAPRQSAWSGALLVNRLPVTFLVLCLTLGIWLGTHPSSVAAVSGGVQAVKQATAKLYDYVAHSVDTQSLRGDKKEDARLQSRRVEQPRTVPLAGATSAALPLVQAGCTNASAFGSATINTAGAIVTISTCSFAGEYSTINGALAGQLLSVTSSGVNDTITIHTGSPGGPTIAFGPSPLVFPIPPLTGTIYAHWNQPGCTGQPICRTTKVQCLSCIPATPTPTPCTAPSITTQPSTQTVCAGGSASFSVAVSGTAPFSYQWRKGGSNIAGATSATYTINPVAAGNVGQYSVTATNACGSATSNEATLTVPDKPTFSLHPQNTTACVGNGFGLSANASGPGGLLTFQWQKNGVNIPGATNGTLSFGNPQVSDTGSYTCIATNLCGGTTSNAATVTINTGPSIIVQPVNQTAAAGATASFEVGRSGSPLPTVQWQVSNDGGYNFSDLAGQTITLLYLSPVNAADNGKQYRAVLTNACGSATSNAATLTVTCPPYALSPASLPGGTVGTGYSQTITAGVGGNFAPDSLALRSSPNAPQPTVFTLAVTAGTLPAGLTLSSGLLSGTPTTPGSSTFTVTATANTGCTAAQQYTVVIACQTITVTAPNVTNGVTGTAFNQSFTQSGAIGTATFTLNSGTLPTGLTLATNGTLSGTPTQSGTFPITVKVTDSNNCMGVSTTYTLQVNQPPTIATSNFSVVAGSIPATLTVASIGDLETPVGSLLVAVNNGASATVNGVTISNLSITGSPFQSDRSIPGPVAGTPVTAMVSTTCSATTATFTLKVTDGDAASTNATLTITVTPNVLPSVTTQPVSQTVCIGSSTIFSVVAAGTGPLSYQWRKNGNNIGGATGTSLTVSPVTAGDAASYTVIVSNPCGSATSDPAILAIETQAPVLTCPANITRSTDSNLCSAVVTYTTPTATDNCPNPTVACLPASGSTFAKGVTTVTCTATDASSNTSTCTFTVTVNDTQAPTVVCPANISVNVTAQTCAATVTYTTPTANDNCPGATTSCSPASGTSFAKGVTTVTCTATDAVNLTGTCTFTVTVTDNQAPTITCPANIFLATTGNMAVATWAAPTVGDNCPGVGSSTCTPASGSSFAVGVTTVTCSVNDAVQNPASCTFTVTVNRSSGNAFDPLVCTGPGNAVQATLVITNNGQVNQNVVSNTTFTNLTGVPGSCAVTPNVGSCTVTNGGVSYTATLTPGTTVTITYLTQVSDLAPTGAQVCTNNSVSFNGGPALTFSACDVIDCPAAGPGGIIPAANELSDQKSGSVLIYNVYTSSTDPAKQNTRINITNTHARLPAFVHFFFVAEGCSVADSYVCLTANQTASFLASDLDPGTTGYLVAVAVDGVRGCPTDFNYLIGDEYVKFASGHAANLGAEAFAAVPGGLPACDGNSVTATIAFDGISYNQLPAVLALSNLGSRADGNDTLLIVNRIGGNLGIGASTLGSLFGILYDDAENALSFSVSGNCQLRNSLSNNFPRTAPRFETFIPAGRTGWLRIFSQTGTIGITGAAINFNANAASSARAFNQGHNLHTLTLNATSSYVIPVFPPSC